MSRDSIHFTDSLNSTAPRNRLNEELIDSSQISVVIQGLTLFNAEKPDCPFNTCIRSIRAHLPRAEIIVSTWAGQKCDSTFVDKVIYNEEIGTIHNAVDQPWNFNKMVISTRSGLSQVSRNYCLKFRADLSLTGSEFFWLPNRRPCTSDEYSIFSRQIVMSNLFARDPASHTALLFHISDIALFGRTEDLRDLWNRDLIAESDIRVPVGLYSWVHYLGYTGLRMCPEQALIIGWLNSHGHHLSIPFPSHLSQRNCRISEVALSTNFFLVNWETSGINFPAKFFEDRKFVDSIYEATYFNDLRTAYQQRSFALSRYLQILWRAWTSRLTNYRFWIDLPATMLLSVSPPLFRWVRASWRNFIKRKSPSNSG